MAVISHVQSNNVTFGNFSTTASSTTVTSSAASFQTGSANVGESVTVSGAGVSGGDLYGTVSSVTSATQVVLSVAATSNTTTVPGWQGNGQGFGGTTSTVGLIVTNAIQTGDLLCLAITWDPADTTTVTISDTAGNNWQSAGATLVNGDYNFHFFYCLSAKPSAAGANTISLVISATPSANGELSIFFSEFNGPGTWKLDAFATGNSTATLCATSSFSTSLPNSVVWSVPAVNSHTINPISGTDEIPIQQGAFTDAPNKEPLGDISQYSIFTSVQTNITASVTQNGTAAIFLIGALAFSLQPYGQPISARQAPLRLSDPKGPIAVLGTGLAAPASQTTLSPLVCTMAAVATMTATVTGTLVDAGRSQIFTRALGILQPDAAIGPIAVLGRGVLGAPSTVPGPLTATMAATGTLTANLTGAGALSDTMAGVGALTASLTGVGALSDTMAAVATLSATWSESLFDVGPAAFYTPQRNVFPLDRPIGPIGTLGVGLLQPAGVIASGGALVDTMSGVGGLTASMAGSGALSDTMAATGGLTATVTGSGVLVSTMAGIGTLSATLAGTLFDVGPIKLLQRALRSPIDAPVQPIAQLGTGLLSPTQPPASGAMTAAMNGVGGMTAALTGAGVLSDTMAALGGMTATLGGAGALTASMASVGTFSAALSATLFDVGPIALFHTVLRSPIDSPVPPIAQLGVGLLQPAGVVASGGSLTDTMNAVGGMTATVAGSGALSDIMAGVGALTASPSGAGALSDAMAATGGLTATLSAYVADPGVLPAFQRALVQPGRFVSLTAPVLPIAKLGIGIMQAGSPPPPGPIFATMNGVGGLTASMVGAGSLSDTMAAAGALSATLSASGALSDTMNAVGTLSANLSGSSGLTDTMAAVGAMSGAVTGRGALNSTEAAVATFAATSSGAGALSASMAGVGAFAAGPITQIAATMNAIATMSGFIGGFPADAVILRFRIAPPIYARFKPGASFRAQLLSTSLGVLTDPPNLLATVRLSDGTVINGVPVRESVGQWHADFLIPSTTLARYGFYRWQSSGSVVGQNQVAENYFIVEPLDF